MSSLNSEIAGNLSQKLNERCRIYLFGGGGQEISIKPSLNFAGCQSFKIPSEQSLFQSNIDGRYGNPSLGIRSQFSEAAARGHLSYFRPPLGVPSCVKRPGAFKSIFMFYRLRNQDQLCQGQEGQQQQSRQIELEILTYK